MIKGQFIIGIEGLKETGFIRTEIFTGDLKMPLSVEKDQYDHFAHHLIIYDGEKKIATGRLILKDDVFLIGRIAVLKESRGMQIGDLVVRMLLDRAFSIGAKEVSVHSLIELQPFYEKVGFKAVSEPFIEATLEHINMTIKQTDISSACGCCNGC